MISDLEQLNNLINKSPEGCATFLGTHILYCQIKNETKEYLVSQSLFNEAINSKNFKVEQANMHTVITIN